jgi:hypothetical protein
MHVCIVQTQQAGEGQSWDLSGLRAYCDTQQLAGSSPRHGLTPEPLSLLLLLLLLLLLAGSYLAECALSPRDCCTS